MKYIFTVFDIVETDIIITGKKALKDIVDIAIQMGVNYEVRKQEQGEWKLI